MRVLFDSDVVIAGVWQRHTHHGRAAPWIARAATGDVESVIAGHSLAQVYRVLTSLPTSPRIRPAEALAMKERAVAGTSHLVGLTAEGHLAVVRRAVEVGIRGGAIYDALIAQCGRFARVDKIVTFNVDDFRRVAPDVDVVAP